MSIESSPAASSPKMLGAVENANSNSKIKAKLKPDDETTAVAGGGFLALMTALEPATELSKELGAPGADPQPGPVLAGLTPEPSDVLTRLTPEPVALSTAGLPNELAMLLAQAGAGLAGGTEPVIADAPVLDEPSGSPMLAPSASAAVSPAALAVDSAQVLPAPDALAPGAAPFGSIAAAVLTTARADQAPPARAAPLSGNPEDAKQSVSALQEQAAQSAAASPGKAGSGGFQSGLATAVSGARGLPQAGRLDLAAREPALSGVPLTVEIGDTLLKPAQRLANKFSGLAASAGVEGAWGHQALLAGSRVSASAALASTQTQSLESMVADTVSYWTTQGVQNAELKLDGFGDEAVAVRISLKGDQAHIGFRTDQPEIRQMLEGALAHLKEVLKSEGLVLAGVSVGSSGQNGAGAQEQRDRADSRQSGQASLITPDDGPVPGRQRINPAVGRALDMFV